MTASLEDDHTASVIGSGLWGGGELTKPFSGNLM